tara:strand:- start:1650 stop:3050 length:1401 start_codon:yes stop_codon:yes gene_type:complete
MTPIITRFAPSPTGNLHIGSARTALINFIVNQQNPLSKFYIRIEDTDKERSRSEFSQNILKGLEWLGLNWENEIQIQSQRIKRHQEIANKLLENKFAYKCICSEEKLKTQRELIKSNKNLSKKICTECKINSEVQELKEGFVIRIKIPDDGSLKIEDKIQGNVEVLNKELDDFILLRKDHSPTYMLSVVVDDNDLGVNFIIRGDDHLNNTFRQNYIYKYLNWNSPVYAHIPLIHGEDGSKLSKRHGAVDVLDFKEKGYLPEAIINNLILLGWSPGKENELIDINEIIEKFEITKLSKSSSIFSYKKLNFFNNYYLRNQSGLNKFLEYCKNNKKLKDLILKNENKIKTIFEVYKKDLNNFAEILDIVDVYFDKNFKLDQNEVFSDEFKSLYKDFLNSISNIDNWDRENIQNTISDFLNLKNIKFPILGKPIRFLMTNSYNGPSISDIFLILGKKDSIDRLNQYIEKN